MAINQTYIKQIIDGEEVMILVEEEIVPDPEIPQLSAIELQDQLDQLIEQASIIQQQINQINELPF